MILEDPNLLCHDPDSPPGHTPGVSAKIKSRPNIATQPLESEEISLKMPSGRPRMAKHDAEGSSLP